MRNYISGTYVVFFYHHLLKIRDEFGDEFWTDDGDKTRHIAKAKAEKTNKY